MSQSHPTTSDTQTDEESITSASDVINKHGRATIEALAEKGNIAAQEALALHDERTNGGTE